MERDSEATTEFVDAPPSYDHVKRQSTRMSRRLRGTFPGRTVDPPDRRVRRLLRLGDVPRQCLALPGARYVMAPKVRHYPLAANPDLFIPHLLRAVETIHEESRSTR